MSATIIPFPLHKAVALFQIKATIADTRPAVWRRFLVRGNTNLGKLHAVLQVGMGWTNSHLHRFIIGEQKFTDINAERHTGHLSGAGDECGITLMEFAKAGSSFIYEYDYGDSWRHVLVVEKILAPNAEITEDVLCIDGARACPPEDCGGVEGYGRLLKILRDPRNSDYEYMVEWLGGAYDPDAFDKEWINRALKKLKGPHTTVDQLVRVLIGRDRVRGKADGARTGRRR